MPEWYLVFHGVDPEKVAMIELLERIEQRLEELKRVGV